jgi:hypothetical protein
MEEGARQTEEMEQERKKELRKTDIQSWRKTNARSVARQAEEKEQEKSGEHLDRKKNKRT